MFEEFKQILVEKLEIDGDLIKPDSSLVNDLGINSIELADLIFVFEDKYNIEIDDDDIQRFITVGDVVSYLENILNK
ncbi:MAG: acyl carrier protein [Clostridia bacterium]|nr:acyl carrier protein [Clostridia bacterium]MBQ3870282.1 acyl carrier protein [Clostridia bacterium]